MIIIPIFLTIIMLAIAIFVLYMMCTPDVCHHGVRIEYDCKWCKKYGDSWE